MHTNSLHIFVLLGGKSCCFDEDSVFRGVSAESEESSRDRGRMFPTLIKEVG